MPAQVSAAVAANPIANSRSSVLAPRPTRRGVRRPDTVRIDGSRARLSTSQRSVRRNQARLTQGRAQERQLARVERLVRGMEALARRISSNRLEGSKRSVTISRFNDLHRQVNKLDGIVVGEGRGDRGTGSVGRAMVASQKKPGMSVSNRRDAVASLARLRDVQRQVRSARQQVSNRQIEARQAIEIELRTFEPPERKAVTAETVNRARQAIRSEGPTVVGKRPESENVVNLLA